MDKVTALIEKLETAGADKVKESLRHGRYSSWKIPHIESWLGEKAEEEELKNKYPGGLTWVDKEYDPNFIEKEPLTKLIIENKTFRFAIATIFAAIVSYFLFIATFNYEKAHEPTNQEASQSTQQKENIQESPSQHQ